MDQHAFDQLTQRLSRRLTRRSGVIGGIVGLFGIAGTAEAHRGAGRRHEKLACRAVGSDCTTADECCSGRCIPKSLEQGGGSRCGKRHKKQDHRDRDGGTKVDTRCLNLWEFSSCAGCPAGSCGYSTNDIMNGCTFLDGLGTEVCCLAENATTWFSTQNAPNYGCCANLHRQWDTDDYYCKTGSCITVEGASCTFHTSDDNCCYPFLCDSGSNTCELAPPTN